MIKKNVIKSVTIAIAISLAASMAGGTVMASEPETQAVTENVKETQKTSEQPPATEAPVTEAPATETPATEAPVTEAPATETPVTETPATEAPVTETPATETPVTETPITEAPPAETPATETSESETSAADTSSTETQSSEAQTEDSVKNTTSETIPETETEAQAESETETAEQTEKVSREEETDKQENEENHEDMMTGPSGEERYDTRFSTNDQLIANQNITTPDLKEDFRFEKIDVKASSFKKACTVKEEATMDSKTVGIAHKGDICYVLEETSDDWFYVESGNVRGYVFAGNIDTKKAGEKGSTATQIGSNLSNQALTHTKTSAYDVVVNGINAMLKEGASVYEEKNTSARVIGTSGEDGCYCAILADQGEEWVFVESGDVRGFAKASDLTIKYFDDEGKEKTANEKVVPEDNKALYYTITSTAEKNAPSFIRKSMVDFALQFVGNPYVWGGTSLTNGADCSGFVQSVYANFGYSLPRVACYQAEYGKQIPVSYAQPGDLVFYASDGYVYHVAMYIGDGMTVQARGTAYGITTCPVGNAVWATSLLD